MGVLLDALRSVEFLSGAPPDAVVRFMTLGRSLEFARGHEFWREGDTPTELIVAVTGEAETLNRDVNGRELIQRVAGPGECLGIVSALDGLPHPQDARVIRGGEFFVIGRDTLLRFLDDMPAARQAAARMAGRIYRRALRDYEEVVFVHVNQRVARLLLRRACVRQCDGARILLHATHTEIASRLGSVREVVARAFASFAQRGLVRRMRRGLFITDWEGLREEAGLDAHNAPDRTASAARTTRFFLPMRERRRGRQAAEDATLCRFALGDLSLCRRLGCPAAQVDAPPEKSAVAVGAAADARHARTPLRRAAGGT